MERNYKTTDLFEGALLYAKHAKDFLGLEPNGRDYYFVFRELPARDTADQYYAREAVVNAKDYSDAIRTLKDLIFSRLRARSHDHD